MEKAATDFNTKFPDSELRVLLFRDAMHAYQRDNNGDKMLEMGRQVLKLDPDDPEAMVGVAEVLTERTKDTDLDKDQKLAEATKLAQHALETIDTNISIPAGAAPEQVDAYKRFLRSSAYAIVGTMQYNKENYKDAEDSFRKSIDAYPTQPDPVVVLRLALTLDKQTKYPEALKEVNRAVELTANEARFFCGSLCPPGARPAGAVDWRHPLRNLPQVRLLLLRTNVPQDWGFSSKTNHEVTRHCGAGRIFGTSLSSHGAA